MVGHVEIKGESVVCLQYRNEMEQDLQFAKVRRWNGKEVWKCITTGANVPNEVVPLLEQAMETINLGLSGKMPVEQV